MVRAFILDLTALSPESNKSPCFARTPVFLGHGMDDGKGFLEGFLDKHGRQRNYLGYLYRLSRHSRANQYMVRVEIMQSRPHFSTASMRYPVNQYASLKEMKPHSHTHTLPQASAYRSNIQHRLFLMLPLSNSITESQRWET